MIWKCSIRSPSTKILKIFQAYLQIFISNVLKPAEKETVDTEARAIRGFLVGYESTYVSSQSVIKITTKKEWT